MSEFIGDPSQKMVRQGRYWFLVDKATGYVTHYREGDEAGPPWTSMEEVQGLQEAADEVQKKTVPERIRYEEHKRLHEEVLDRWFP